MSGGRASRAPWLLVVLVAVLALNLRAPITAVGPVLEPLRDAVGLSGAAAGLLGALPVLAFAAVSPVAPRLADRWGLERVLFGALVVLAAGTAVRVAGWALLLFAGTLVLGAAIAVGNVLLPALLRRDTPARIGAMTAFYTTCMGAMAAAASGVAVPLDDAGGWQLALGCWALVSAAAAGVWLPGAARARAHDALPERGHPPWTSMRAWQVSAFMGLQSVGFYSIITWLPSVLATHGVSPAGAGAWLVVFQLVALVSGIAVPLLAERPRDQRGVAVLVAAVYLAGPAGLAAAPGWYPLWICLCGLGAGGSLSVALMLMSLRAGDAREAAGLSAMAQSLGYVVAAAGPLAFGILHDATGAWTVPLVALACVHAAQAVAGLGAGRAGALR